MPFLLEAYSQKSDDSGVIACFLHENLEFRFPVSTNNSSVSPNPSFCLAAASPRQTTGVPQKAGNRFLGLGGFWQSSFDEKLAVVVGKSLKIQQATIREMVNAEPRVSEAAVVARLVQRLLKHASHLSLERRESEIRQILELDCTLDRSQVVAELNRLAMASLPAWLSGEFWSREVDPILLTGIRSANQEFEAALGRIQSLCPAVPPSQIQSRHAWYRSGNRKAAGIAAGLSAETEWPIKADRILREALALERKTEEAAIQRVFQKHRDLRPEAIKRRMMILQKRLADARQSKRFSKSAATGAESLSASQKPQSQQRCRKSWDGADLQYLWDHVNHQSVPNIARALGRSCKSVSRKLEDLGERTAVSKRSLGIFSLRELRSGLHVRHSTLLRWIAEGKLQVAITKRKLKRGRQQHVREEDLMRFFESNLHELDLTIIDPQSDLRVLIDEVLANQPTEMQRHAANA